MNRFFVAILVSITALSACETSTPTLGADGKPIPRVYRIHARDEAKVQYRMLDSVNALRTASGLQAVALNASLNAAAATHSLDMENQNRPWHFGSDGSSPVVRVARSGYAGSLVGENISETYESELETLAAWMETPATRAVVLDSRATDLGIAWHQEQGGKLWWTLILGSNQFASQQPAPIQ